MTWFTDYGFEADPYNTLDPVEIPNRLIAWNREDLASQRRTIDAFLTDATTGHRTGLVAFGAIGAGKTWLGQVVEAEFRSRLGEGVVFATKIEGIEPTFDVVYARFISSFLAEARVIAKIKESVGS